MKPRSYILAGLAAPVAVVAVVAVAAPAAASVPDRALWEMDELVPIVMADSSGNGNDGTPTGVVGDGSGYTFSGSGSRVVVPTSESLNPGTASFSYSVTVVTGVPVKGTDYDLLRKGLSSTAGGEYKVEILNASGKAKALCLVKDTEMVVASIRGATDLADGKSHTITCVKSPTGVTVQVDNLAARTKTVSAGLGSVSNSSQLLIGTKTPTGGDDFIGTMTQAWVGSA